MGMPAAEARRPEGRGRADRVSGRAQIDLMLGYCFQPAPQPAGEIYPRCKARRRNPYQSPRAMWNKTGAARRKGDAKERRRPDPKAAATMPPARIAGQSTEEGAAALCATISEVSAISVIFRPSAGKALCLIKFPRDSYDRAPTGRRDNRPRYLWRRRYSIPRGNPKPAGAAPYGAQRRNGLPPFIRLRGGDGCFLALCLLCSAPYAGSFFPVRSAIDWPM